MTEGLDSEFAYIMQILEAERRMRYRVFHNRPDLREAKVAEMDRAVAFVRHLADEYKRLKDVIETPLPDVNWCLFCGSGYEGENPNRMCWRCAYDRMEKLTLEACVSMQAFGQELEKIAERTLKRLYGSEDS